MRFKYVIFFAIVAVFLLLTSCGEANHLDDGKISVVCTAFAQYDWVREIVGDKADRFDITYIADNGVDMHSYQPTAEDIIMISDCDILISVGGVSEQWIDDAVRNSQKEDRIFLRLIDILGDNVMTAGEEDGDENFHSVDEHVWLSLKNAMLFCEEICSAIKEKDMENAEYYLENTSKYTESLDYIDKVASEFISSSPRDTVIMADRFPFRYTLRDYGIKCFAAFEGCSSDSEATFETVIRLSGIIDSMDINAILITDDSDGETAEAVISNSENKDIVIYKLDSMQSVSDKDIKNGMTYISVMRDNLALIHGALIV